MTMQERIKAIEEIRKQASNQMSEEGFTLFDLAFCGHMTPKDQERFILSAKSRGLVKIGE